VVNVRSKGVQRNAHDFAFLILSNRCQSSHHLPEFEINYLMDLFKIGDIYRHNYRPYLPVWETGL